MKINSTKAAGFEENETVANTSNIFEVFKNDLVGEWVKDKKDVSELDEQWLLNVSGQGSKMRDTPIIPLIYDYDNDINNDDDSFLFVA